MLRLFQPKVLSRGALPSSVAKQRVPKEWDKLRSLAARKTTNPTTRGLAGGTSTASDPGSLRRFVKPTVLGLTIAGGSYGAYSLHRDKDDIQKAAQIVAKINKDLFGTADIEEVARASTPTKECLGWLDIAGIYCKFFITILKGPSSDEISEISEPYLLSLKEIAFSELMEMLKDGVCLKIIHQKGNLLAQVQVLRAGAEAHSKFRIQVDATQDQYRNYGELWNAAADLGYNTNSTAWETIRFNGVTIYSLTLVMPNDRGDN